MNQTEWLMKLHCMHYGNVDSKWTDACSIIAEYGTAQRQRHKRTQLFCDLRVRNECVLSMHTSLDFRIL